MSSRKRLIYDSSDSDSSDSDIDSDFYNEKPIKRKKTEFLPFDKALHFVRSLGLVSSTEWRIWYKSDTRPSNVPTKPEMVYKNNGWKGYGHWLGTGNNSDGKKQFLSFKEALAVARSFGLTSRKAWTVWCKEGNRPNNVPACPDSAYRDAGWQDWGHWLGTGNIKSGMEQRLPFGEALAVARSLRLASSAEWYVWCKEGNRSPNVPSTPHIVYKHKGWQGWGHWLGTGNVRGSLPKKHFLPFDEAILVTQSLGLANSKEWHEWGKEGMRPANLPGGPDRIYKHKGWQGWAHWLGTGNVRGSLPKKHFLPFDEAILVTQSLGLANSKEWYKWGKEGMRPANLPGGPDRTYKHKGWQGWGHWLGTGNQHSQKTIFLPFVDALLIARSLGLASQKDWYAWSKSGGRPVNVPSAPNATYKNKGWKNWQHWLGTDIVKEKPIKIKEEPHQEPIVFNTFDEEEYKELYKWVMSKSLNVNKGASSRTRSNNIQVNKRTGELIVTCLERILNKKGLEENIRTLYEKGKKEELYSILKKIEGYLLNKESPFPSEYKEGDVIEVIEIKDYEVIDIETFVIDIMITKVIKKEKEFSIKIEKEF
jgi:hypothetical protein